MLFLSVSLFLSSLSLSLMRGTVRLPQRLLNRRRQHSSSDSSSGADLCSCSLIVGMCYGVFPPQFLANDVELQQLLLKLAGCESMRSYLVALAMFVPPLMLPVSPGRFGQNRGAGFSSRTSPG